MLSPLFNQIETLIPTLDGWCTVERASELAAYVVTLRPQTTVCIGVWGGRDTFALALAHKLNGFGGVVAIDPWTANASVEGQTGQNAEWWASQENHELVYGRFITTMAKLELQDYIEVRRERSSSTVVPKSIGVLITDGNHGTQAINDVERFAPHVIPGGICYMDDIDWDGGAVVEAVGRLIKIGYRELHRRDGGAFFQRI